MKSRIVLASLALVLAGTAFAQTASPADPTATPRIDARQVRQQKRIDQGVASGELTPRETARLEKGEAHIATAEQKAKADGAVTGKERARLTRMENKQSKRIHRQKHDAQKSG